jgi:hypothetical protein
MSKRAGWGAALAVLALCGLAAGAGPVRAEKKKLPESNLELLDRALLEAARDLVARSPLTSGTRVGLVKSDGTPLAEDAERALLAALTGQRMEVWVVPAAAAESSSAAASPAPAAASGLPDTASVLQLRALQQQRAASAPRTEVFDAGGASGPQPEASRPPLAADLPLLTVRVEEARVDYPRLYRTGLFGGLHVERRALGRVSARLLRPGSRAVYWVGEADTSLADHVPRSYVRILEDASRAETKGTVPAQTWQRVVEPVLVVGLIAGLISLFYTNRP